MMKLYHEMNQRVYGYSGANADNEYPDDVDAGNRRRADTGNGEVSFMSCCQRCHGMAQAHAHWRCW